MAASLIKIKSRASCIPLLTKREWGVWTPLFKARLPENKANLRGPTKTCGFVNCSLDFQRTLLVFPFTQFCIHFKVSSVDEDILLFIALPKILKEDHLPLKFLYGWQKVPAHCTVPLMTLPHPICVCNTPRMLWRGVQTPESLAGGAVWPCRH